MDITKREAQTVLNALAAGVVPRSGLRHIAVGRLREVASLRQDLEHIGTGGAAMRLIIGRYGSGKSFLLQLIRNYALESHFVVADADFSPERRLYGSSDEGLALYRELMRNLAVQTRPDGNALPTLIEKWISAVQVQVVNEEHVQPGDEHFEEAIQARILRTMGEMQEVVHGFDFGMVLSAYFEGYMKGDDHLKAEAIRWLRGEFNTRSEAYSELKVHSIIDSDNYYDYLKAMARFVRQIGYSGLLVCLDEAAYLYKISNSISRKNNYEMILAILNDCLQGKAGGIGFLLSGTPEFLEDERRGLFSYEALRSRLAGNRFATAELQDFSGPVITLTALSNEEIFVLLQKIRELYTDGLGMPVALDDAAIQAFMQDSLRRVGASEFSTPRELIRDYVSLLNLMAQYPEKSWEEISGMLSAEGEKTPSAAEQPSEESSEFERFGRFRVS
jgi:hypothetical protein